MSFPHQTLESDLYTRKFPAISSYWYPAHIVSKLICVLHIFSGESCRKAGEPFDGGQSWGSFSSFFLSSNANAANGKHTKIYHIDFFITPYYWYFQRSVAGSGASAGKCLQGIRNPLPGSTYCHPRPTRPTNVNQGQPESTYCQPRPSCLRPGPGDPQCRSSWSKSGLQKPRIIETR